MSNFHKFKGGVILVLFLIFQSQSRLQALANISTVCNIDTTKNNLTIKLDAALTLKAGSTIRIIVKNADTTIIINGIAINKPKKTSTNTHSATILTSNAAKHIKTDVAKNKVIGNRNNEPATRSFTARPPNVTIATLPVHSVIKVKNQSIGSTIQKNHHNRIATVTAPPVYGVIQVKNVANQSIGNTLQKNHQNHIATIIQPDSVRSKKVDKIVTKDSTTIKKIDTLLATKVDTTLMRRSATTTMCKDTTDSTGVKAKSYYLEIGGPGLAISANYDTRFNKRRNGWGYRIGLGGFIAGGNRVFSIPFQINYLIGKHASMLELGAGSTFLSSTGDNKGKTWEFDKITGFIGTVSIGYRYQPEHKGINYRIAFVPIIYDEGIIPAGGISIGYTFK